MDPVPPGVPAAPAVTAWLPAAAEALLALGDAPDLESLERRLLGFAVHPEGLGARGGWVLHLDPATSRLAVAATLREWPAGLPLRDALRGHLALQPPTRAEGAALDPAALAAPLAEAWHRGTAALCEAAPGPAPWRGMAGAVPLRSGLRPYGLLVLAWDQAPAGAAARLAAFQRLAMRAAELIERATLERRRLRQRDAVRELARLAVSPANLAEAVRLAVRSAAHGTQARGSALWLAPPGGALELQATHGPAGRREAIARDLAGFAAAARDGRPLALTAATLAGEGRGEVARLEAALLQPLVAFGAVCGVIAVYDPAPVTRDPAAGFDADDREFLALLADQVAALADAARRFDELRDRGRRVRELEAEVRRLDARVAEGARAAAWLREARAPLAAIAAFARRMQKALAEDHPHRAYLEIVLREAERLEQRAAPPPAAPRPEALRVESLNAALHEVIEERSERLVRRRVRLLKRLAPDLPPLLLDPAGLKRTLDNIVGQALDRVAVGGRVRIESRRAPHHVVVDVAHDGPRHPGEALEELFAPFAAVGPAPEPSLALARRIVGEHGGEVRLRSEGEWTSIVSLTLPVAGNEDRRGAGDRRGRPDRRAAPAPA